MPEPDETSREALQRFDKKLDTFEASRSSTSSPTGLGDSAGQGYRMFGQIMGGVLGGLGFGWLFDRVAHTAPLGIVVGLLLGSGLSMFAVVRAAMQASAKSGPTPPGAPDDDEE